MVEILKALQAVKEIIDAGRDIIRFIEENKTERWFQDSAAAFKDFRQKTPDERKKLAKDIHKLIKGL